MAAFLAGLLSFLSPCVLPLVPGYVSLISGTGAEELDSERKRVLGTVMLNSVMFIVGFSGHTTALVFYLAVGATGLVATLATRFEPRIPDEHGMTMPMAA